MYPRPINDRHAPPLTRWLAAAAAPLAAYCWIEVALRGGGWWLVCAGAATATVPVVFVDRWLERRWRR